MKRINQLSLLALLTFGWMGHGAQAQTCSDFQNTTLSQAVPSSQTTWGTAWYTNNNVSFQSRYVDFLGLGDPGSVTIADHVTSGYTGSNGNTNFAGNIFYQGNAETRIDLSGVALNNKVVEFDINYVLGGGAINPFRINNFWSNNMPYGVTYTITPLTNGGHVVMTGPIQSLFIRGHEVAIDNFCVDSMATPPTPLPSTGCIPFEDSTSAMILTPTDVNFGMHWYAEGGISLRSKYVDYLGLMNDGSVHIDDHVANGYTGSNGNTNFMNKIFFQGNAVTEIDLNALPGLNKSIEFDVNYIPNSGQANPFRVNGDPVGSLPTGVTYSATPLTNGFKVALSGPITTIELHGHELAIDNLCYETFTLSPPIPPIPPTPPTTPGNGTQVVLAPTQTATNTAITLPAGAKVYDRNGLIVLQPTQAMTWNGEGASNQLLPMGGYTVVLQNGDVIQVTIIR